MRGGNGERNVNMPGAAGRTSATRLSILLVDDSPTVIRTIERFLRTVPEVAVWTAEDGVAAVEQVHEEAPDVIVMDVQMPRMNGIEATRRIKQSFPDVKVVMVSVHDVPAVREASLECGADAFVSKNQIQSFLPSFLERCFPPSES